eukprot:Opistho-2@3327
MDAGSVVARLRKSFAPERKAVPPPTIPPAIVLAPLARTLAPVETAFALPKTTAEPTAAPPCITAEPVAATALTVPVASATGASAMPVVLRRDGSGMADRSNSIRRISSSVAAHDIVSSASFASAIIVIATQISPDSAPSRGNHFGSPVSTVESESAREQRPMRSLPRGSLSFTMKSTRSRKRSMTAASNSVFHDGFRDSLTTGVLCTVFPPNLTTQKGSLRPFLSFASKLRAPMTLHLRLPPFPAPSAAFFFAPVTVPVMEDMPDTNARAPPTPILPSCEMPLETALFSKLSPACSRATSDDEPSSYVTLQGRNTREMLTKPEVVMLRPYLSTFSLPCRTS